MPVRDLPAWVCAVCRRSLMVVSFPDADDLFFHLEDESHDPVPVCTAATGGEVVGSCDFDSAPGPRWVFPCRDFTVADHTGLVDGHRSCGAWAACEACYRDIMANRWKRISTRALAKAPPGAQKLIRQVIEDTFEGFRTHRLGDPYPLW